MPSAQDAREAPTTFSPHVLVLSAAPTTTTPPDLRLDAILDRFPGLAAAEAICLSGSTAAGWGNSLSDVDILAFSDMELELPSDDSSETWVASDKSGFKWRNWMGRYGDNLADVQVWSPTAYEALLEPYLKQNGPEYCALSDRMQEFIYRLSVALPLKNPDYFESAKNTIRRSSYPRSLARSLKVFSEYKLTDVDGQLRAGDVLSARLTATLTAQSAADSCLVLAGNLCRTPKWMMRRLQATPECGIDPDEYRSVVLEGTRPGESDHDCAVRVARWAQSQIIRIERDALSIGDSAG